MVLFAILMCILTGCKISPMAPERAVSPTEKNRNPDDVVNYTYDLTEIGWDLTQGNLLFAFDIFKEINEIDSHKNIFISPFSISTALTMTYNGAKSTTKEAMENVLCYGNICTANLNNGYKNLLTYLNNGITDVELNINNSIWYKKGKDIKQEFLTTNRDDFSAHIACLDFRDKEAANIINQWIDGATKGKIDKMIDPPIPADVIMYLINAIYFKGQWTIPFDKEYTFTGVFNREDGQEKEIQMMTRKGKAEYGEVRGTKIVRLPYGNEETAIYCILPEKGAKINDYVNKFDLDEWLELKDGLLEKDDVRLQIPKFKIEYGMVELNDTLINLGMGEAFSGSADFSGIGDGIYISQVLHEAVIDVNEEGSEAAAVTVVVLKEICAAEPVEFIADRPFLFVITDDKTGTILFMGKFMGGEE